VGVTLLQAVGRQVSSIAGGRVRLLVAAVGFPIAAEGTRLGAVAYSPCRRGSSLPSRARLLAASEEEAGRRQRAGRAARG
jgi:hypothetical protein